jgi:hypothetical protein
MLKLDDVPNTVHSEIIDDDLAERLIPPMRP